MNHCRKQFGRLFKSPIHNRNRLLDLGFVGIFNLEKLPRWVATRRGVADPFAADTLDSIATPCSVKTVTRLENFRLEDVTNCDIPAISSRVNSNMKSDGNRSRLRLTLWFSVRVSTPYNSAKSRSSITFSSRMRKIALSKRSTGIFMNCCVM